MASIDLQITLSNLRDSFRKMGIISNDVEFIENDTKVVRNGILVRLNLSLSDHQSGRSKGALIYIIMIGHGTTFVRMFGKALGSSEPSEYRWISNHDDCWSDSLMSIIKDQLWTFHEELPNSDTKCYNDREEFGYIAAINKVRVECTTSQRQTITKIEEL